MAIFIYVKPFLRQASDHAYSLVIDENVLFVSRIDFTRLRYKNLCKE